MDDMRLKYLSTISTGRPTGLPPAPSQQSGQSSGPSFADVLAQQMEQSQGVNFSKHAVKRVSEKGLDITQDSLTRLNEGVKLAAGKNLDDTLILVDNTAFVVNVKNNTVITAMGSGEMKGNVFTNINGTVII